MLRMAKTSPAVLPHHRSYADHGTGVTVWPLLRPAALLTSVPAATARTALESARPKRPTSQAHHPSALLTLRPPGPAASPVMCRLADPPSPPPLYFFFLNTLLLSVSVVLRALGLALCHSRVIKLDCLSLYISFGHCLGGRGGEGPLLDFLGAAFNAFLFFPFS